MREPAVVRTPAVQMLSFSATGTPASAPERLPACEAVVDGLGRGERLGLADGEECADRRLDRGDARQCRARQLDARRLAVAHAGGSLAQRQLVQRGAHSMIFGTRK